MAETYETDLIELPKLHKNQIKVISDPNRFKVIVAGMEDEEIRRLYEAGSIELIKELAESGGAGKNVEHIKKFKENNDFSPSWD